MTDTCTRRHTRHEEAAAAAGVRAGTPAVLIPNDGGGGANVLSTRSLASAANALRERDFRRFWLGALAASSGIWMQNVTVPLLLYERTGRATWAGLGALCQFAPAMLASPFGGVAADRYPRRRIVATTQVVIFAVAAVLAVLAATGNARPGYLLALVAVTGTANGLQTPAWQGLIPDLVRAGNLLNAVTLNAAQANIARALGPAAAGVLLARYGPAAAFGANAATNVVMLTALATIRPARRRSALVDDTVLGRVLAGARYTRRHAGLALSVLLAALVSFVGTPVVQLAPVFAREVFHVGDLGYGVLVSGLGIGACIGTVLVSAYGQHTCRSRIAMVAVVVHAVAALALGAAPSFLVAVGATVVLGVSYLAVVSAANATIQLLVADEYRGRVVSLYWMAFAGAYPLGAVAQGFVADVAGPRIAVAAAGVLLLAVLAVVARGGALGALDEPATRPAPSPARVGRAR